MSAKRDVLISMITALKIGIQSGQLDESSSQNLVSEIAGLVPNSRFSDMYFYPEKCRSVQEMADELTNREKIFEEFGESYLNGYIRQQYERVANDPEADVTMKYSALAILSYM